MPLVGLQWNIYFCFCFCFDPGYSFYYDLLFNFFFTRSFSSLSLSDHHFLFLFRVLIYKFVYGFETESFISFAPFELNICSRWCNLFFLSSPFFIFFLFLLFVPTTPFFFSCIFFHRFLNAHVIEYRRYKFRWKVLQCTKNTAI